MAKKKTATKGTKKTSTASRKKGPVKKSTTPSKGKPAKKTTAKKPATKKPATKSAGTKPAKKMSGLDAAAKILADAGEPLRCREIVDRMLEKKLWTTNGATPHATIYAALIREIASKGSESRFEKTGRGLFTLASSK